MSHYHFLCLWSILSVLQLGHAQASEELEEDLISLTKSFSETSRPKTAHTECKMLSPDYSRTITLTFSLLTDIKNLYDDFPGPKPKKEYFDSSYRGYIPDLIQTDTIAASFDHFMGKLERNILGSEHTEDNEEIAFRKLCEVSLNLPTTSIVIVNPSQKKCSSSAKITSEERDTVKQQIKMQAIGKELLKAITVKDLLIKTLLKNDKTYQLFYVHRDTSSVVKGFMGFHIQSHATPARIQNDPDILSQANVLNDKSYANAYTTFFNWYSNVLRDTFTAAEETGSYKKIYM